MNKRIYILTAVVAFAVIGFFGYQKYATNQKPKVVKFEGDAVIKMGVDSYEPTDFEIKKGATVKFVNEADGLRWPASDLHPSHLVFSEFDPKEPVAKGASWEFKFEKAGEWGYHDHLAPYITGTIKVTE